MSNRLLNLAWLVPLPAPTKLLLIALADRGDDAGKSWPSRDMLCTQTGLSPASVSQHVQALIAAGLLSQQRRRQRSAEYALDERAMILAGQASTVAVVSDSEVEKSSSKTSTSYTSTNKMSTKRDQDVQLLDIPKENPHRTITNTRTRGVRNTPDDRFDDFWTAYPRRGDKQMRKDDARKAWLSIVKALGKPDADGITWTVDQIIAGARRYASECADYADRSYVKTAGPWLRAGGWKYDDQPAARDPTGWLREQWKAGRVAEIHQHYRSGYTQPDNPGLDADAYAADVLKPYNRQWITEHHDRILAQLTSEAS